MSSESEEAPELLFDDAFWSDRLKNTPNLNKDVTKLHLVLSLIVFLSFPLRKLLNGIFDCEVDYFRRSVGVFLGYRPSSSDPFPPATIFNKWRDQCNYPDQMLEMIKPVARDAVLAESDRIIADSFLKVSIPKLTLSTLRGLALLNPAMLAARYREHAPFLFELLEVFAMSPNRHRKYNMAEAVEEDEADTDSGEPDDWDVCDEDETTEQQEADGSKWRDLPGFSRNPIFAIILTISMLAFVRNRATNLLPLLLCLFFKISGTSTRVIQVLSNAGVCVSGTTAERLKKTLSDDAIRHAVDLVKSGKLFVTIFDNINIFLRKFQQRLTNRNSMIHATNAVVFAVEGASPETDKLQAKLDLRGARKAASVDDILPTADDDANLEKSFVALVAEAIIRYTPGSRRWKDRAEMLSQVELLYPKDRPLEPKKTDARPIGVFDVDEGSKKGIVDVLGVIRERLGFSEESWSSKTRLVEGDWLTVSNFRNARRIRRDDVNSYERLEYVEEQPALFHFALQASHMILRVHLGHAVRDPMSLAAHKGLLRRTWNVNKPSYAPAKSLIRHSLIARILHIVMVLNGFTVYSDFEKWTPDLGDILTLSEAIVEDFASTPAAERAKAANDDHLARSIYFIRDALMFCKFEKSVSIADAGGVMRILRYWTLAFRGAGQHNYARECAEVLLHSKYELTDELRLAREQAWFYNRWGVSGRTIAADLYLEQNNFWVKRVFIASGNGVTIEYIIEKGSACVEAFREVSHLVANFFGDSDRARRHKEVAFHNDIRALVEEMVRLKAHVVSVSGNFVPASPKKPRKNKKKPSAQSATARSTPAAAPAPATIQSAVFDVMVEGAYQWNGKFNEFLKSTTWDPQLGYPLPEETSNPPLDPRLYTNTIIDSNNRNPVTVDGFDDVHGDEIVDGGLGAGALGGGDEFSSGYEEE